MIAMINYTLGARLPGPIIPLSTLLFGSTLRALLAPALIVVTVLRVCGLFATFLFGF